MIYKSIPYILYLCTITGILYSQKTEGTLNEQKSQAYLNVLLDSDIRKINCLVFPPADSQISTGIILVHEEWGLTNWALSISSQIADQGYLVIMPDLMSAIISGGEAITDMASEDAVRTRLLNASHERIRYALDAAYKYLTDNPLCNGKIVVIGFSWGGTQAFSYLTENNGLTAGFVFYGRAPENKSELARIKSPVYGIYGEYDTQLNNSLKSTERKMKRSGITYQSFIINGGGHGFMRSGERYGATEDNIKARTEGWNTLMDLLKKYEPESR